MPNMVKHLVLLSFKCSTFGAYIAFSSMVQVISRYAPVSAISVHYRLVNYRPYQSNPSLSHLDKKSAIFLNSRGDIWKYWSWPIYRPIFSKYRPTMFKASVFLIFPFYKAKSSETREIKNILEDDFLASDQLINFDKSDAYLSRGWGAGNSLKF